MLSASKQLKILLEEQVPISTTDWEYILSKLQLKNVKKGTSLTTEGLVEQNLYFLHQGICRLFYEKEDRDITINFGFPKGFISSYSSFLTEKPSQFILEALTDCEVLIIPKSELEQIYKHTKCGQQLGRIFSEQFFLYLSERETSFMLNSPTERYLALFEEHPRLVQEIPLKFLASYIGITPQALSRIRAKIN